MLLKLAQIFIVLLMYLVLTFCSHYCLLFLLLLNYLFIA